LKIIYPICCGVDVHKRTISATIAKTDRGITSYQTKAFLTFNEELYDFKQWLLDNQCYDVCMESIGKYWIPLFNILEKEFNVILTHPKYVRAIKGKKTDKKDSKWIADLFKHDLVKASFIPPPLIRSCRELARYRAKLVYARSSEKNRYQDCMTNSNLRIASVLSDPFGETSKNIMNYVLSCNIFDEEQCKKLIKSSAKRKADLIIKSVRGYLIKEDQKFKMNVSGRHIDFLDTAVLKTEAELYVRLEPHYHLIELLSTIPGISELSAALILSEIGMDMNIFDSSKHLTSWAGLAPANNESAGKKKTVRISKAGQFLKPLLVQCALSAIKDKQNTYFCIKYNRIKNRRGHKKAIVAIARMMLNSIYHMLKTGESFNPSDYEEFLHVEEIKRTMNVQKAITFLKNQGYDVSQLNKAI